jgi:DNA-binding MarR family transcriptional regulator
MSEYDRKKEILKDIILKEEDVLAQLERIVKLAKPFVKIEGNTGRVVLSSGFTFTNSEKIFLFLLGKYLAYHSDVTEETTASMSDISEGLGIVATTLSAPLGRLVKDGVVDKTRKDSYQVNPHKIEATLKAMSRKKGTTPPEGTNRVTSIEL